MYMYIYYSFNIFPRFWLVETTHIIHHNQLLFTKFGKKLCHIESMTSKVQPAADYWSVDRKKTGAEIVLFLFTRWLWVGLEVWAKKIWPSYLMIKTERYQKVDKTTLLNFLVLPQGEKHQKSYNCSGVSGSFTKVLHRVEKKGWIDVLKKYFEWIHNKAIIIECGFRRIWRILQISENVIHLGLQPRRITPSYSASFNNC